MAEQKQGRRGGCSSSKGSKGSKGRAADLRAAPAACEEIRERIFYE